MRSLSQVIDVLTLGSDRPIRRLIAYYLFLFGVLYLLQYFIPQTDNLLMGKGLDARTIPTGPIVLQDGLSGAPATTAGAGEITDVSMVSVFATTALILIGTILLMMPVSWVYMSARHVPGH